MTALMQAETGSDRPVLLRYHTKAGHSPGMPARHQVEQIAEVLAFVAWQLGMEG